MFKVSSQIRNGLSSCPPWPWDIRAVHGLNIRQWQAVPIPQDVWIRSRLEQEFYSMTINITHGNLKGTCLPNVLVGVGATVQLPLHVA
jgi:hypothetical protein